MKNIEKNGILCHTIYSELLKGVPFESSEQTISAVIGGIPLISDRM